MSKTIKALPAKGEGYRNMTDMKLRFENFKEIIKIVSAHLGIELKVGTTEAYKSHPDWGFISYNKIQVLEWNMLDSGVRISVKNARSKSEGYYLLTHKEKPVEEVASRIQHLFNYQMDALRRKEEENWHKNQMHKRFLKEEFKKKLMPIYLGETRLDIDIYPSANLVDIKLNAGEFRTVASFRVNSEGMASYVFVGPLYDCSHSLAMNEYLERQPAATEFVSYLKSWSSGVIQQTMTVIREIQAEGKEKFKTK
jgi:hypothetical protein